MTRAIQQSKYLPITAVSQILNCHCKSNVMILDSLKIFSCKYESNFDLFRAFKLNHRGLTIYWTIYLLFIDGIVYGCLFIGLRIYCIYTMYINYTVYFMI